MLTHSSGLTKSCPDHLHGMPVGCWEVSPKCLLSIAEVMEAFLLAKEMAPIKSLWVGEWDIALVEIEVLLDTKDALDELLMTSFVWTQQMVSSGGPHASVPVSASCLRNLPGNKKCRLEKKYWKISNLEELLEYKIMKWRFRKTASAWNNRFQISTQNIRCVIFGGQRDFDYTVQYPSL